MTLNKRPMRYAHANGHIDVCYSTNGKHILTCGRDGDVRIWLGIEDDDPHSVCIGEWAQSVQCVSDDDQTGHIYVATDAFCVFSLKYPKGERDGVLVKFTAPVSHLAVSKSRKFLVAGGGDMTVKIVQLNESGSVKTFSDVLTGPSLSVAISDDDKFIAVSSGDGSLRVWNVETESVVKTINCVPFVNNFIDAIVQCRPSFSKKSLAYPDEAEVKVIDMVDFKLIETFTNSKADGQFSIVSFSPCGLYLAASTTKGTICVWNVDTKEALVCLPHAQRQNIRSMVWNPSGNGELAYCDATGQLGTIEGCYAGQTVPNDRSNLIIRTTKKVSGIDGDDDDDDGDNVYSLDKIKHDTMGDFLEDINIQSEPNSQKSTEHSARHIEINTKDFIKRNHQAPFQPGSTPKTLTERYLVWNNVGIVKLYANDLVDDDDVSSIDVIFHDTSYHHSMHLKNYLNHSMASLSKTALVLASEGPGSKLNCIPLTGAREWIVELPDDEEVIGVGTSDYLIAVGTDARYLRIFLPYGTQREVISIPGPIVSIAANDWLILCAYHTGPGLSNNDQNIALMIINVVLDKITTMDVPLAISPSSTLTWLGFTDKSSPATFDSRDILRIFNSKSCVWMPVYDHEANRKGLTNGLFVVDVSETAKTLTAISCKGSRYPPIAPQPVVNDFKFQIPLCEITSEKSKLEGELVLFNYVKHTEPAMTKTTTALKLFSLATRSDQEQRAIELMTMLESTELLNLAIKYSFRNNRVHLAEKLNDILNILYEKDTNDKSAGILEEIRDNHAQVIEQTDVQTTKNTSNENEVVLKPLKIVKNKQEIRAVVDRSDVLANLDSRTPPSLLNTTEPKIRNPFGKKIKPTAKNLFNSVNSALSGVDSSLDNSELLIDTNDSSLKRKANGQDKIDQPSKQTKLSAFTFTRRTDDGNE